MRKTIRHPNEHHRPQLLTLAKGLKLRHGHFAVQVHDALSLLIALAPAQLAMPGARHAEVAPDVQLQDVRGPHSRDIV